MRKNTRDREKKEEERNRQPDRSTNREGGKKRETDRGRNRNIDCKGRVRKGVGETNLGRDRQIKR